LTVSQNSLIIITLHKFCGNICKGMIVVEELKKEIIEIVNELDNEIILKHIRNIVFKIYNLYVTGNWKK